LLAVLFNQALNLNKEVEEINTGGSKHCHG